MLIFKKVSDIQHYLSKVNTTVSFVPTMGALHEGHLSLIKKGKDISALVVASIFVNPTQFNEKSDLDAYPITIEADIQKLQAAQCDVLFLPSVEAIYPENYSFNLELDFESLTSVLEGAKRPGHFEGVVEVVYRLLSIVKPDFLVMGQKDYQQYSIIQSLIKQTNFPSELVMGYTMREDSGLAMSSRNTRLRPDLKPQALSLSKALNDIRDYIEVYSPKEALEKVTSYFDDDHIKLEYIEIVDGETLLPVTDISNNESIVACCAAWIGDVRLIDNVLIK